MINDQEVERLLIDAGERQRAGAPDVAAARHALEQLNRPRPVEFVESKDWRRGWPIAVGLAAAAAVAVAVVAAGNSSLDTIRPVPATQPEVTTPSPETSAEVDNATAPPELLFGQPAAREFEGLPLTDVAISPDADRIAANRGDEICVVSTKPLSTSQDRCYPAQADIGSGSLAWSPDGTTLVFHNDAFRLQQESDLIALDLATGDLEVLTEDGVTDQQDGGDQDVAPVFAGDGTLYFLRWNIPESVVHRYGTDGVASPTELALDGVSINGGRSAGGNSIVMLLLGVGDGSKLVSIDVVDGTVRSIPFGRSRPGIADIVGDRVLLVSGDGVSPNGLEFGVGDFVTGETEPVRVPQVTGPSTRLVGGGFSPDGRQVALIVADEDDANGHLLLVADIAADGSVGVPEVVATGPDFAPNDGDRTIKPAGIGRVGEIVWTDTALIYTLGPNEIVTLPLR